MKELGQKGDMVKLVRDVLFVNVQPTEEKSPYSPRRDRLTPNRHRSVSNKRRRISSSQETRHELVGECTYDTKPSNESQCVRTYCDCKILS